MRNGICKFCGNEFIQPQRGKKRAHCKDEDCLKKAKNETQRKWYANKLKNELGAEKIRIVSKVDKPQIIYSSTDRSESRINNEDFSDIIEVSRELGAVEFKIQSMLNKENQKQSYYDREDQDFLHKLEGLEELTDKQAIDMLVEEKIKREIRRSHKIRKSLLMKMVEGKVKNPSKLVIETIKNRDKFKYNQRVNENERR